MTGFSLVNGDVAIENNEIVLVDGDEALRQKIQNVLMTNNGEWFDDWDEGIDFHQFLIKKPDEDTMKGEILEGLGQVDEDLILSNCTFDYSGRKLKITITLKKGDSELEVSVGGDEDYNS